ncbi:MAG: aspartate dehydrogenase domain-containing protein [Candidatus Omnitrophota bacterium]
MKKIGIVGCGVIGSSIAEFISKKLKGRGKLVALADIDTEKAKRLSKKISSHPSVTDLETLMKISDLIVEAANPKVSSLVIQKAVKAKKDALIMSTGGALKHLSLLKKAKLLGINIYIPSGAICGLDGLKAASIGKVTKVGITTRKPPKGLIGAPYFIEKGIDISSIKKETVVFSGTALEAIKHFPKNVNVSATLSILGIGPKKTRVNIVTSPEYTSNTHEVEVEGDFGKFSVRCQNVPSKENPKTSQLAIYSAQSMLKEIV